MSGKKGRSGRRRARYTEEGDQLIRTDVYIQRSTIEKLRNKNVNLSEFTRKAAHLFLNSPFDIDREETERKIREKEIELSILRDHLDKINSESEKARQLQTQREKEAPIVNLIIARERKLINRKLLGAHLASYVYQLGLVDRAGEVTELIEKWVKPIFPYIREFILEDIKSGLDKSGFEWPISFSKEEAVRYALVDVCGYSESVLSPQTEEERIETVKSSTLARFPRIENNFERKQVIDHLEQLRRAYSIDKPANELLETFYRKGEASINEP